MEERRFGVRTGVMRILRLLDKYGLRASFFVPGYTIEHHVDSVRAVLDAGHELGAHGNVHEALDTLSVAQEEQVLRDQLAIWEKYLHMRPDGYRAPSWELNLGSPALLKRYGFLYDSSLMGDDIPYSVDTPEGPLMEVPVQWLLDDAPMYRYIPGGPSNLLSNPDQVIRTWGKEFKGMYDENGCFVLTLHPWISGRAGRLLAFEELIGYIRSFPNVWFTTTGEVARWAISQKQKAAH